jgi:uncharacterized 2Fe-2S/4Fe-4S cluster protein (DUF4445 family)
MLTCFPFNFADAISAMHREQAGQLYRDPQTVFGGGEACGLCGSGLIDAVAVLLDAGILKASGRFAVTCAAAGYLLDPADTRTAVTGTAAEAFQRAKAAAAAAVEVYAGATLAGCEMALLSPEAKNRLIQIARNLSLVNGSLVIGYEDLHIEELRLRPIAVAR